MKRVFILGPQRVPVTTAVLEAPEGWQVTIEPERKNKTAEQRAKFHVLCERIGKELGETPAHVKGAVKQSLYGFDEFKIGNQWYRIVRSSEDNDRPQYSDLIEHAYLWAAERGVYVE